MRISLEFVDLEGIVAIPHNRQTLAARRLEASRCKTYTKYFAPATCVIVVHSAKDKHFLDDVVILEDDGVGLRKGL